MYIFDLIAIAMLGKEANGMSAIRGQELYIYSYEDDSKYLTSYDFNDLYEASF